MAQTVSEFQHILSLVGELSSLEKVKLLERIASMVEDDLSPAAPLNSLYGLCADLGPVPSDEDIAEVRREMWANFPRDDIA